MKTKSSINNISFRCEAARIIYSGIDSLTLCIRAVGFYPDTPFGKEGPSKEVKNRYWKSSHRTTPPAVLARYNVVVPDMNSTFAFSSNYFHTSPPTNNESLQFQVYLWGWTRQLFRPFAGRYCGYYWHPRLLKMYWTNLKRLFSGNSLKINADIFNLR